MRLEATGRTGRTSLRPDADIPFFFPGSAPSEFRMHDTPISLSIAFVDEKGRIVDLLKMAPKTDDRSVPPSPLRFAIEANPEKLLFQSSH